MKQVTRRSNLRQVHWGLIDQALNTGTNFILLSMIARSVSAADFGAFASGYAIYMFAIGLQRTSGNTVLTIANALDPAELERRARDNSAYAIGHGVVFGAICIAIATIADGAARNALVVLGLALPVLLLQDSVRGLFLAQMRPHLAMISDAIWVAVQFGGLAALVAMVGRPSMTLLVATWACGGVVAAIGGLVQARITPSRQLPHAWLVAHGRLTVPILATYLLGSLPSQATYLILPAVSDLRQVGILRAAYLLFGPMGTLFVCIYSLTLPDAVHAQSDAAVRRLTRRTSWVLTGIAMTWGLVIVLLPASIGHLLLGATWDHTLLPRAFLAVSLVAEGFYVGARVALGALQLPGRMVRVLLITSPVTLSLTLVIGMHFGAAGAAAGLMIGYSMSALLMWRKVPNVPALRRPADVDGAGLPPGRIAHVG